MSLSDWRMYGIRRFRDRKISKKVLKNTNILVKKLRLEIANDNKCCKSKYPNYPPPTTNY